jgi:uncharacterized protein (TIGR03435 family)
MRTESRELLAVGIFSGKSRMGDRIEMLLRGGRTFSPRASAAGVAASTLVLGGLMLAGSFAPRWIAFAQQPNLPKFEVISIRPCSGNPGGRSGGGTRSSPGRLNVNCITLGSVSGQFPGLIQQAYGLFANGRRNPIWSLPRIEGGPAWINSDRYEISAKAEGDASQAIMTGPMMQALLEDRFKLKTHRATREVLVYALTVARRGPKLQPFVEGTCIPLAARTSSERPAPGQTPFCKNGIAIKRPNLVADMQATTLTDFANALGIALDRPLVDKTGIAGRFDFHLQFAIDESTPLGGPPAEASDPARAPSIFTAVQEQLGLRLESAQGPVDVLVIDHVEKPDEN